MYAVSKVDNRIILQGSPPPQTEGEDYVDYEDYEEGCGGSDEGSSSRQYPLYSNLMVKVNVISGVHHSGLR